ncbi:MAG: PIN domain-containing protein [Acidobacteria bacterium]|nr:PIN domain-containing protein [Acidobacteriota bacterium]MBI3282227.1 PIN domain-containing protein [Acidobacteriota bacterium]
MKVYLDACCLNRLTDDQTQLRIRQEAEAVEQILRRMQAGEIQWISSDALVDEIARNPDVERRLENAALLSIASQNVELDDLIASRAADLQIAGYGAYDALHFACAEAARVDVLLTTDDGFIHRASRRDGKPLVAVLNPLFWSKENLT